MNDRLNFKAELSNEDSTVETELALVSFQEEGVYFVYCPALDLTGYGDNEEEAKSSFATTLKIYLDYTINNNTLLEDLEKHGWRIKSKNKLKSPDFAFLFKHNEQFKSIVNYRSFSKYNEIVKFPEYIYA